MDVRLPDGTILQNVPDDITKADLVRRLQAGGVAVPADWIGEAPKRPQASQEAGTTLREIPRQVGLTARAGLRGLAQLADIGAAPIRELVVNPLARLVGAPQARPLGDEAESSSDAVGLPAPRTADERVVGDMTSTLASGGGMVAGARKAATVATGIGRQVFSQMAANPGVQLAGAAGAGGAGGSVREAGGGPLEQFVATLGGAVAGGGAAAKGGDMVSRGADALRSLMTPRADRIAQAEGALEIMARRSGIDWAAVPQNVRAELRREVADALSTGRTLDQPALARLAAFRQVGATPTVGQLRQDPVAITREQNLSRIAANSDDAQLQRLPRLVSDNTGQLLRRLDDLGAARAADAMGAGERAVSALSSREASARAEIDALYQRARDSSGRSLPLEGGTFSARANALLDEANVGSFLPQDIANKMNAIAAGKYPLTVDVAEQLKTSIGNLQRGSSDGNVRRALGIVRQALDEAPLQNSGRVNPGGMPAIPGQVPPSVAAGEESISAFNAARAANRAWMQRVERNPALRAVVDGVEPDQFIARFVVGKGASARDVRALVAEIGPQDAAAIRDHLVRHLRNAATNSTDDITKFSNDSFRRAMRDIGEDKLRAFFSPEDLQQLRAIGDVGKYMQAQPAGSAVNNSNSGALVAARGYDLLDRLAGFVPLGGREVIRGKITQPLLQRQALDPIAAILQAARAPRTSATVNPLLALTVPAEQYGQNDRSD